MLLASQQVHVELCRLQSDDVSLWGVEKTWAENHLLLCALPATACTGVRCRGLRGRISPVFIWTGEHSQRPEDFHQGLLSRRVRRFLNAGDHVRPSFVVSEV